MRRLTKSETGSSQTSHLSSREGVEVTADLGDGIVLAKVGIDVLREQDVNARTMDSGKFSQLVANIKSRGTLEQLPYCAQTDRGVEIVSGHHRVKASKAAGLDSIDVLLDVSGLSRSAIASKQLAHNAIEGTDDPAVVKAIAAMITDVDDMLASAVDPEVFADIESHAASIPKVKVDFDYKTVQFTFLPVQLDSLKRLCDEVSPADFEGVADVEQFDEFVRALNATKKFADTRNVSSTVGAMTKAALEKYFGEEDDTESLAAVFGHGAIQAEKARKARDAIGLLMEAGKIANPWDVFDYIVSEVLEGEASGSAS